MLVVGLNGSPNKNGNTMYLLNKVKEEIENLGAEFDTIQVQDAILDCKHPFCIGCSNPCNQSCYKNTKLEDAYNLITKADSLVVASPVYFGTLTAQLKCFFDKARGIRAEKKWIGKPAGCITVGASKYGGQEMTVSTINNILLVHGFTLVGTSFRELRAGHFGVSAQKPAYEDKDCIETIKLLANRLVEPL